MNARKTLAETKDREKVVAEITCAHLMQLAIEEGVAITKEEVLEFLNQRGYAHEMWKRMMRAGEDYVRSVLLGRPRKPTTRAWALAHRQFQQV
jgi:hypothetical protein